MDSWGLWNDVRRNEGRRLVRRMPTSERMGAFATPSRTWAGNGLHSALTPRQAAIAAKRKFEEEKKRQVMVLKQQREELKAAAKTKQQQLMEDRAEKARRQRGAAAAARNLQRVKTQPPVVATRDGRRLLLRRAQELNPPESNAEGNASHDSVLLHSVEELDTTEASTSLESDADSEVSIDVGGDFGVGVSARNMGAPESNAEGNASLDSVQLHGVQGLDITEANTSLESDTDSAVSIVVGGEFGVGYTDSNAGNMEMIYSTAGLASASAATVTGETRDEKVFRMWINSLAIDNGELYINDLFADVQNGYAILRVMDRIQPGVVEWKRVNINPKNRYKMLENGEYIIDIGKVMDLEFVNVTGADIVDGNRKMMLAIMWKLMLRHTHNLLQSLSKNDKSIEDPQIVVWANSKVDGFSIRSFADPSLSTGVYLLEVCHGIDRSVVKWDLVTMEPGDEDDKLNNAKYAISVASKLGAYMFVAAEDIVQVKSKRIMLFCASLWQCENARSVSGGAAVAPAENAAAGAAIPQFNSLLATAGARPPKVSSAKDFQWRVRAWRTQNKAREESLASFVANAEANVDVNVTGRGGRKGMGGRTGSCHSCLSGYSG